MTDPLTPEGRARLREIFALPLSVQNTHHQAMAAIRALPALLDRVEELERELSACSDSQRRQKPER